MSFLNDIAEIERRCRDGGFSLSDLFGWVAQNAYGVDVHLRRPLSVDTLDASDASNLEELKAMLQQLQDALDALNAEVTKDKTQLAGIVTYVQGVPALVAAAVQQALASTGTDEATAASLVNQARDTMAQSVDATVQAVQANATDNAAPVPTPAPTPTPAATDTTAAAPAATDTTAAPAPATDGSAAPATDPSATPAPTA